jgi:cell division protein FtsI (penicillin-binding protein 3)
MYRVERTVRTRMRRSKLVSAALTFALFSLAVRAMWVQGINDAFYRREGARRLVTDLTVPASRGNVVDLHGRLLATSVPTRSLWIDAFDATSRPSQRQIDSLAHLVGADPTQIARIYASNRRFAYVRRNVPRDVAARALSLRLPGLFAHDDYRRSYPEGRLASNVIGFAGIDGAGREGIEYAADHALAGTDGNRQVLRDELGNIIDNLATVSPHDGRDVRLSIDLPIQYAAATALEQTVKRFDAASGSAIVLDAQTGGILAMANWPNYDPNRIDERHGAAVRNRAVTDAFEPGSVLKPLTIALALQQGKVSRRSIVTTGGGTLRLDGVTIHDDADFGTLTVAGVIQKSSNVGTTKIALMMQPRDMWRNLRAVGFGTRPDAGLPGEAAGRLRPWRDWRRIDQATISYGYGLSASLLQLAQAYTVFADDGCVVPATIFGSDERRVVARRVYSARVAREVRAMMQTVAATGGTAPLAAVPGYSVAGKTGTAYRWTAHGYDKHAYRASFVGIVPASRPRAVIAVSIDQPRAGSHFGGAVAGPAFASIAARTMQLLAVPPDSLAAPTSDARADVRASRP